MRGGVSTGPRLATSSRVSWSTYLELIVGAPAIGAEYRTRSGKAARRVLMPKTRTHVYFEVDRAQALITILAIWGAPRGKDPAL